MINKSETRTGLTEVNKREELPRHIAGIINNELTGLVLLASTDGPYTGYAMAQRMTDLQGDYAQREDLNRDIVRSHIDVLVGTGLLQIEKKGTKRTQLGDKTIPLAGQVLNFSISHPDISLGDIFGTHVSLGWYNMYKLLIENGQMKLEDLATQLGQRKDHVERTIEKLHERGLLKQEGKHTQDIYQYKAGTKEELPSISTSNSRYPSFARHVLQIMQDNPDVVNTSETIAKQIMDEIKTQNYTDLRRNISNASSELQRLGYIDIQRRHGGVVSLEEERKDALMDLVNRIEGFRKQDPSIIMDGEKFAEDILTDSDSFSSLIGKVQKRHRDKKSS